MAPPSLPTVALMQPTLVAKPFHRAGWLYEEKYDGWRMVAYKGGPVVRLVSRNGRDLTQRFPELGRAVVAASVPAYPAAKAGAQALPAGLGRWIPGNLAAMTMRSASTSSRGPTMTPLDVGVRPEEGRFAAALRPHAAPPPTARSWRHTGSRSRPGRRFRLRTPCCFAERRSAGGLGRTCGACDRRSSPYAFFRAVMLHPDSS
jgi:hypothetical protein